MTALSQHGTGTAIGLCCALCEAGQGHLQPVTNTLGTRIRRLLGGRHGAGAEAPSLPDPPTQPPAAIRTVADLETAPMQRAWTLLEAKKGSRRFLSRAMSIGRTRAGAVDGRAGRSPSRPAALPHPTGRYRLAGNAGLRGDRSMAAGLAASAAEIRADLIWSWSVTERMPCRARRHAVVDGAALHYEAVVIRSPRMARPSTCCCA